MRITIVGCGDAFGSGGRYNTASLVEISDPDAGDRVCLLDCGATTMTALNAMGIDPDRIDLIMLTHLHGDHIGGLMENGAPAFPKARYVTGQIEYDFWTDKARD